MHRSGNGKVISSWNLGLFRLFELLAKEKTPGKMSYFSLFFWNVVPETYGESNVGTFVTFDVNCE
jgi:hypothetical protein